MRPTTSIRLLLASTALVLGACEDSESPFEAPEAPEPAQEAEAPAALVDERWADGYALDDNPSATTYTPLADFSYNRAGGRITIQRPATGRYIVTFAGLSAKVGAKSTVHVTAAGVGNNYCKPVAASLAADKVEVRCTDVKSGTSINSEFTILVLRKAAGRAFAYANKPTIASYTATGAGTYNPAGTTRINRLFTGNYYVQFNGLGAKLGGKGGHVQVSAVGIGKAWCKTSEEWSGNPNLTVLVQCYTTGGVPVDAKFTVLFQLPSAHLGYAYTNLLGVSSYNVDPFWGSNPAGGQVTVNRINLGAFAVRWMGADSKIIEMGNVQVTALGTNDNSNCMVNQLAVDGAVVVCYAANGAPVDVPFTILLGS